MAKIENGIVVDDNVESKTFASIEHDNLTKVSSIVLHRTDSTTADGTLNAYANGKKAGAHFLIDKTGYIYQTASLLKTCWHVGILLPRCQIEKSCNPKELKTITALIYEEGLSFGRRAKNLSRHEVAKKYPLRYPSNNDSIGIEIVGKFLPSEKSFEKPTLKQLESTKWLIELIATKYGLSINNDVYAHGAIARKEVTEGAQLLQYIFSGAV
ncbi:peptidoglycan recognition protein family protein [Oceanobacter mangrovi]|uniref:peptidoglycan recognition protein family protein n=1 Tax=Oceanobacter mangrovi TaxID=2862510 RepID=UPI001C8E7C0E|nr:peptidoglycan recognition family protein [Oceanobacter mangrovi]